MCVWKRDQGIKKMIFNVYGIKKQRKKYNDSKEEKNGCFYWKCQEKQKKSKKNRGNQQNTTDLSSKKGIMNVKRNCFQPYEN